MPPRSMPVLVVTVMQLPTSSSAISTLAHKACLSRHFFSYAAAQPCCCTHGPVGALPPSPGAVFMITGTDRLFISLGNM